MHLGADELVEPAIWVARIQSPDRHTCVTVTTSGRVYPCNSGHKPLSRCRCRVPQGRPIVAFCSTKACRPWYLSRILEVDVP
jgi:hypothetical protein